MSLRALARAARALDSRAARSPVDHIAWLPGQLEFLLHDDERPVLYRAGNRQGKSTVGCAELIFRARGAHPYKAVPAGPVRLAMVCFAKIQSIEIQRVLWELLGGEKSEDLVHGTEFSSRTGFRGHRPVVEFRNGSEIHVYGNAQGAGALAGAEFDWILMDEPPAREVYDECRARVRNTGGGIGITLTPINGPPLPWLRHEVEEGRVRDIHVKLTAESQVSPLTGVARRTKTGTPWDAEFIAELERLENPIDAPIRLHGEWESRTEGQFFACFDPERHVARGLPGTTLKLALGIDYAAADRELGMCAVLSAVDTVTEEGRRRKLHHVYAVDEVVAPGSATTPSGRATSSRATGSWPAGSRATCGSASMHSILGCSARRRRVASRAPPGGRRTSGAAGCTGRSPLAGCECIRAAPRCSAVWLSGTTATATR